MDDLEKAIASIVKDATSVAVIPGDTAMSSLAAFRRVINTIPHILEQILAEKDPDATEALCGVVLRLMAIIRTNLQAKDEFAGSPEFQAALAAFRSRSSGSDDAEVIHAR